MHARYMCRRVYERTCLPAAAIKLSQPCVSVPTGGGEGGCLPQTPGPRPPPALLCMTRLRPRSSVAKHHASNPSPRCATWAERRLHLVCDSTGAGRQRSVPCSPSCCRYYGAPPPGPDESNFKVPAGCVVPR